jgi:hypothetical protein
VSLKANRAICMILQIALSYIKMAVRTSASNLTGESPLRIPGSHEACESGIIVNVTGGSSTACSERSSNSGPPSTASSKKTNAEPKPFVWTAHRDRIIAAVLRIQRGIRALESMHLGREPLNAEVAHGGGGLLWGTLTRSRRLG